VVSVAHRALVGSLERLLNALIDRLLMRRLLGMRQRLQRIHIVGNFTGRGGSDAALTSGNASLMVSHLLVGLPYF
jgi:hypothetical protein